MSNYDLLVEALVADGITVIGPAAELLIERFIEELEERGSDYGMKLVIVDIKQRALNCGALK